MARHRFLPTDIKKATTTKGVMLESRRIKELNRLNNQKKIRNPKLATKDAKKALPDHKPKSLKQTIILRSET